MIQQYRPGVTDPTLNQQIRALRAMNDSQIDRAASRVLSDGAGPQSDALAMMSTDYEPGSALLGSAVTTAIGFGILGFAFFPVLQQFGVITAIMIGYAFLASVLVLPSLLVLWARHADVEEWTAVDQPAPSNPAETVDD